MPGLRLLALMGAFSGLLAVGSASALPGPGAAPAVTAADELPLVRVHGCHFDMGPGMAPDHANGPHYHDNQCRVIRVGPPGGYRQRDYDEPPRRRYREEGPYGYEGRRRYREGGYGYAPPPPPQPVCYERCRYTGPIKRCRTVCE